MNSFQYTDQEGHPRLIVTVLYSGDLTSLFFWDLMEGGKEKGTTLPGSPVHNFIVSRARGAFFFILSRCVSSSWMSLDLKRTLLFVSMTLKSETNNDVVSY